MAAMLMPSKVSADVEEEVAVKLRSALVSAESASDDCVKVIETPSTPSVIVPVPPSVMPTMSAVWAVPVETVNLFDGAVVPTPTRSFVESIDKVEVSKLSPATPPDRVTLVSTAKVAVEALKVGMAFRVKVSVVASPKVVFPFTVRSVENMPAPTTSRATVGAVVPIPRRLEKDAVPDVKIC
jgi:hypothetical protein